MNLLGKSNFMKKREMAIVLVLVGVFTSAVAMIISLADHNKVLRKENIELTNEIRVLRSQAPKSQIAADILSDYVRLSMDSGDYDGFHSWAEEMPLDSLGITEDEILSYGFCY